MKANKKNWISANQDSAELPKIAQKNLYLFRMAFADGETNFFLSPYKSFLTGTCQNCLYFLRSSLVDFVILSLT